MGGKIPSRARRKPAATFEMGYGWSAQRLNSLRVLWFTGEREGFRFIQGSPFRAVHICTLSRGGKGARGWWPRERKDRNAERAFDGARRKLRKSGNTRGLWYTSAPPPLSHNLLAACILAPVTTNNRTLLRYRGLRPPAPLRPARSRNTCTAKRRTAVA